MHLDSSQGTGPFFIIPPALRVPVQPGSVGRLLVPADRGEGAAGSSVQCVGSPLGGAAARQIPSKGRGLATTADAAAFRGVPTEQPLGACRMSWECFTSRHHGLSCLWV